MTEPGKGASAPGKIPFTPRAKKALELSLRESLSLGHNFIGTRHVVLGLIRDEESVASQVLKFLGIHAEDIRETTFEAFAGKKGFPRRERYGPPRKDSVEAEAKLAQKEDAKDKATPLQATREQTARTESASEGEEAIEAVPTHSDRPAIWDELGRERLAEVLGERIRRVRGEDTARSMENRRQRREKLARDRAAAKRSGSFMVHVYAPWGAGKSSLLNFLAADLHNRLDRRSLLRSPARPNLSQWIVVDFSAWEHQRLVAPWWWLLASIQRACSRELWRIHRGRWAWYWLRDIGWRLWNARAAVLTVLFIAGLSILAWALDWFGLPDEPLTAFQTAVLTVTAAVALVVSVFNLVRGTSKWLAIGSAERAVRFLKRSHDPLGVYRRRFRWLVRSSGRPICVFIDDLDRCKPAYVVELLEGIQTLFADEPVTFVVAADRNWLCRSFETVYDEFDEAVGEPGRPLGFLFLEKTFQISLEIPPMSDDGRSRYWGRLMHGEPSDPGRPQGTSRTTAITESFAGATTQMEVEEKVRAYRDGGDSEEVLVAAVRRLNAPDLEGQQEKLLAEFAPLLENNPRSLKRLLNAYGIERDRLLRDGNILTKDERRQLALLTILKLRWPEFADHLCRYPTDAQFCAGPSGPRSHPFKTLFENKEVQALFDGSQVDVKLDSELLALFPSG
jgi:hypothetical protein